MGTLINKFGRVAGWNNVKVVMLGRQVEGITALSYKDSVEKENVYGAGGMPVGRGEGNYKAEASITLLKEEVNALLLALDRERESRTSNRSTSRWYTSTRTLCRRM